MTFTESVEIVRFILAGFPAHRAKMDKDDVRAMTAFYADGLADLDADVARKAITRLAMTSKFIPTVAEIREAVGVVHHGEQPASVIAWGEIHMLMRTKGAYRTPGVDFQISDPTAREVARSIGWEDMCTGEQNHIRARFLDGYEHAARNARRAAQASPGGANPQLGAPRPLERVGGPKSLEQLVAAVKPEDPEAE